MAVDLEALAAGMNEEIKSQNVVLGAYMRRVAYLEGELRRIAHGNWSSPTVDSASANTYAQIVDEMQNIAKLALTAIVAE